VPPTLLISAMGHVEDTTRCVTMDGESAGNLLIQVGRTGGELGGSHLAAVRGAADPAIPRVDLERGPGQLAAVGRLVERGLVRSAHDCSEGGMLVAAAEMAIAGRVGLDVDLSGVPRGAELSTLAACFAETPSRVLVEVEPGDFDAVARLLREADVPFGQVGTFAEGGRLSVRGSEGTVAAAEVDRLFEAWHRPLDW